MQIHPLSFMPENRYEGLLEEHNQELCNLLPARTPLKTILAYELKKVINNNKRKKVLEIGVGDGDLTKFILDKNEIDIDLLDISQKMIEKAKRNLFEYSNNNLRFITKDVNEYLNDENLKNQYNAIYSSWTLHNFPKMERQETLKYINQALKPEGTFIWMDKVYWHENHSLNLELLKLQNKRYEYLPKEIAKAIINHEKQDFLEEYRIDEVNSFKELKNAGFRKIKYTNRVERELIIIAQK